MTLVWVPKGDSMSPCTRVIGRRAVGLRGSAAPRADASIKRPDPQAQTALSSHHDAREVLVRDRVLRRQKGTHLEDRPGPIEVAGRVEEHAEVVEQLGGGS